MSQVTADKVGSMLENLQPTSAEREEAQRMLARWVKGDADLSPTSDSAVNLFCALGRLKKEGAKKRAESPRN